jgi:glutamate dehydrogenase/leucine dehydrogenase
MFREAARSLGLRPNETRFVVQGFGNVGSWAARIFCELGCTLVGVSDVHGAIGSHSGIDPEALLAHIRQGGELAEYSGPGVEALTAEELMALDCEVLIPAALGGTIHAENADTIRARLIIEGANSPTTRPPTRSSTTRVPSWCQMCSPTPAA